VFSYRSGNQPPFRVRSVAHQLSLPQLRLPDKRVGAQATVGRTHVQALHPAYRR
jgi:hypothetical protein